MLWLRLGAPLYRVDNDISTPVLALSTLPPGPSPPPPSSPPSRRGLIFIVGETPPSRSPSSSPRVRTVTGLAGPLSSVVRARYPGCMTTARRQADRPRPGDTYGVRGEKPVPVFSRSAPLQIGRVSHPVSRFPARRPTARTTPFTPSAPTLRRGVSRGPHRLPAPPLPTPRSQLSTIHYPPYPLPPADDAAFGQDKPLDTPLPAVVGCRRITALRGVRH